MTKRKDEHLGAWADFELRVEPWTDKALCAGRPLGFHDTDRLTKSTHPVMHRRAAQKLCAGCPVVGDCAAYALKTKAIGVVMAGIPLKLAKNGDLYADLRSIAGRKFEDSK